MKKTIIALLFAGTVALSGCGDTPEVVTSTTTKTTTTTTTTTTTKKTTKQPTTTTETPEGESGTGDSYSYEGSYDSGVYPESGLGEAVVAEEPMIVETTDEADAAVQGEETSTTETTETSTTSGTTTSGTTTSGTSTSTTTTTTTTTSSAP